MVHDTNWLHENQPNITSTTDYLTRVRDVRHYARDYAEYIGFKPQELDLLRQWFNSIEDTGESYLELPDYLLYQKIMNRLGARISNRTLERIDGLCELHPRQRNQPT